MNRRRALVLYEIRKMKWLFLAGTFWVILFLVMLSGDITGGEFISASEGGIDSSEMYGSRFSYVLLNTLYNNHVIILFFLAVLVAVQFWDLHRKKREEYMSSLPFVKRERFIIKSLVGLAVLFADWLILVAGTLIVRQNVIVQFQKRNLLVPFYKELLANETVWHTLRTLGILGLELLAAYSILVMLQTMVNQSAAASAFGVGVMLAPVIFAYVVNQWYICITGKMLPYDMGGWEHLARIFIGDSLAYYPVERWEYTGNIYHPCHYVVYWPAWQAVLVLMAVILVSLFVIWKLSRGRDAAENNTLVAHKGVRVFLAVGIGLCAGAAFAKFFPIDFLPVEHMHMDPFAVFVLLECITSPIFVFVSWKILKISIR